MSRPKLVKFWAEWCEPCHKQERIFAELEREFGDRLDFWRVNVDEETKYAESKGVRTLPTLLLIGADNELIADLTSIAFKKEALRSRLINEFGL